MALQKWPNRGASNATPADFMSTRRTQRRSFFVPSPSQIAEPSFVAVDFETANRMGGVSACQVAMVKVCDGQIVDRLNTLIRPPKGWDSFEFTYLHGISAADVADAPSWTNIADTVSHFVDGVTVYAHNAAFDSRVWCGQGGGAEVLVELSPHPGVESGVVGVYGRPIHKVGDGVGNVDPAGGVRDVGC